METSPSEMGIMKEIIEPLAYLKHSKPNPPALLSQFPRFAKNKRSRQITLQGILDLKAIEEKERLLFQQTSQSTVLDKNQGRNKQKRKSSLGNENRRPSPKRVQTDAPLLSVQPKFNSIEKSGTKLIFRKVDQSSASTSVPVSTTASPASSTLMEKRTPLTFDLNFPPPVDS